jgi:alpha-beta hydrolase superfamily lysophospholipase
MASGRPEHGRGSGHGLLSAALRAEDLQPVDKVVLLAPLVRPHQWWRGSLLHSVLKLVVEGIPRTFVDNSHDAEFLHFLREGDPLQSRQLSARWVSALKEWLTSFRCSAFL